ncbi:MAG: hypothetical protein J0L76_12195 [Rhodobacterales bacterium]|nr:hypothetical protein [Rhodobacterales bacterium]
MTLAEAVQAERPSVDYFTGLYQRIGRDAEGKLMEGLVRLDPLGKGLALTECPLPDLDPPLELAFDDSFEVENFLTGRQGPFGLSCQYFNDSQNYPILNCWSDGGALFTLWPLGSGSGCVAE